MQCGEKVPFCFEGSFQAQTFPFSLFFIRRAEANHITLKKDTFHVYLNGINSLQHLLARHYTNLVYLILFPCISRSSIC
jgi:hypothetical protein